MNIRANIFPLEILSEVSIGEDINPANPLSETERRRKAYKGFISRALGEFLKDRPGIALVENDFVRDMKIWVLKDSENDNNQYLLYEEFRIKIEYSEVGKEESYGMRVYYGGSTRVLNRRFDQLTEETQELVYNTYNTESKTLLKNDNQNDVASSLPILSNGLRRHLGIEVNKINRKINPYKVHLDKILDFYSSYLVYVGETNQVRVYKSGFGTVSSDQILKISGSSNELLFGNHETNYNVYNGIKLHGPFREADEEKDIRFVFIFHERIRATANRLYLHMKKGFKNFPGLKSYVGIDFVLDSSKSIIYKNNNPVQEVLEKVAQLDFDHDGHKYVALYLTEYDKDEEDEEYREIYFKLKQILLGEGVTSQVINCQNIERDNFNFFLPNIAIAILAKVGGIPWLIKRDKSKSLVIGIGAKKKRGRVFIGNTIAFDSAGNFVEFDAFEKSTIDDLGKVIESSILSIASRREHDYRSIIIHFYKEMNHRERIQLDAVLANIGLELPYVVLTINEESKYIYFDDDFDGKMPVSGTIIKLWKNEYLLYNNTRYSERTRTKIDTYPFPVRVRISQFKHIDTSSERVVKFLLNQVYQFSRIYWKSVRQRSFPVTVEYSKIVAEMISHFDNYELPDNGVAKETLWFL